MNINKILSKILSVGTIIVMLVAFLAIMHLADTTQDILKGIAVMLYFGLLQIITALKRKK